MKRTISQSRRTLCVALFLIVLVILLFNPRTSLVVQSARAQGVTLTASGTPTDPLDASVTATLDYTQAFYAGQTLTPLVTGLTMTNTVSPTATLFPGQIIGQHIVKPGEGLLCIARAYGILPSAIQQANNLPTANLLQIGQKLDIPFVPWINPPPGKVCESQFTPVSITSIAQTMSYKSTTSIIRPNPIVPNNTPSATPPQPIPIVPSNTPPPYPTGTPQQ